MIRWEPSGSGANGKVFPGSTVGGPDPLTGEYGLGPLNQEERRVMLQDLSTPSFGKPRLLQVMRPPSTRSGRIRSRNRIRHLLPNEPGAGFPGGLWMSDQDGSLNLPTSSREVRDDDIEEFIRVVRTHDDDAVDRFVAGLIRDGISPEGILSSLIPPTAHRLGDWWEDDSCDFVEVTLVLGRLQRLVRSTLRKIPTRLDNGVSDRSQIILSALPGQQHTLGLLITSHFFRLDGWGVEMGPPFLPYATSDRVSETHFDVVAFSVATSSGLDDLAREIERVRVKSRNPSIAVMVGGGALTRVPDLVKRVGADGSATDAESAPAVARTFIQGPKRSR